MTRNSHLACGLVLAALGAWNMNAGAAVVVTPEDANSDTAYDASASGADLVNTGQPSFVSVTSTRNPTFGAGNMNDGASATSTADTTFYRKTELSSSVTFTLDTAASPNGYDISTIRSIAGWSGANETQANQRWELLTRSVGSPTYHSLGTFDHSPFTGTTTAPSSTRITLTDTTGVIASNVDAVRVNLYYPGFDGNNSNPGTVVREIDVEGLVSAAAGAPAPVNLLQNASFESPVLGGGAHQRFTTTAPLDSNWTIDGEVHLVHGTFGTVAADAQQWLALESFGGASFPDNVGSISQTFATIPMATYELSFDYNALGHSSVTEPWSLTYDLGGDATVLEIPNPANLTLGAWYHESVQFMATGPLTTLTFTGETKVGGFYGPAIDNASVTYQSIPEPSTFVLAALGLVGLGLYGWRRRTG